MAEFVFYGSRWGTIRYKPEDRDSIRPGHEALEGRRFLFNYSGVQDDGHRFEGQTMWMPDRQHDKEIPEELRAYWLPEQDIVFDEPLE